MKSKYLPSFVKRRGRITKKQELNVSHLESYEVLDTNDIHHAAKGFNSIYIEIGFGDGENIISIARENPDKLFIGSEVYQEISSGKFHDNPDLLKSMHRFRKQKIYKRIHRGKGLESSRPIIDMLKDIALNHNSTPSQIALNWLINFHGNTVFAIPGATNIKQTENNMSAANINLSDEELNNLNIVSNNYKEK